MKDMTDSDASWVRAVDRVLTDHSASWHAGRPGASHKRRGRGRVDGHKSSRFGAEVDKHKHVQVLDEGSDDDEEASPPDVCGMCAEDAGKLMSCTDCSVKYHLDCHQFWRPLIGAPVPAPLRCKRCSDRNTLLAAGGSSSSAAGAATGVVTEAEAKPACSDEPADNGSDVEYGMLVCDFDDDVRRLVEEGEPGSWKAILGEVTEDNNRRAAEDEPKFTRIRTCEDTRAKQPAAKGRKRGRDEDDGDDACKCSDDCGSQCMNRITMHECTKTNCRYGADPERQCSNRSIQRFQGKKTVPRPTPGKGWGLFADEDIEPGDYIIEYVGEVLDAESKRARLAFYKTQQALHYYMMEIVPDEYIIDAGMKGNNSRFINHSCNANAETHKIRVGDTLRAGIYAASRIPKGTEITYDYSFVTEDPWECLCRSKNCRKKLGFNKADALRDDLDLYKTCGWARPQTDQSLPPHTGYVYYSAPTAAAAVQQQQQHAGQHAAGSAAGAASSSSASSSVDIGSGDDSSAGSSTNMMPSLLTANPSNKTEIGFCVEGKVMLRGAPMAIPNRYTDHEPMDPKTGRPKPSKSSATSTGRKRRGLMSAMYYRMLGTEAVLQQLIVHGTGGNPTPQPTAGAAASASSSSLSSAAVASSSDRSIVSERLAKAVHGWCSDVYSRHVDVAGSIDDAVCLSGEGNGNEDTCAKCHRPGTLVCCDACPKAYHISCVSGDTSVQPWHCPACKKSRKEAARSGSRGGGDGQHQLQVQLPVGAAVAMAIAALQ